MIILSGAGDVADAGGCELLSSAPTANLQFDLIGDCLSGGDGDPFTTWADESAAANDLGTIDGAPTKETDILNGHAVAKMNGDDDAVFSSSIAVSANFTYIVVAKLTNLGGPKTFICGPSGSLQVRINSSKLNVLKCATADMGSGSSTISIDTFYTLGVTYDGTTLRFYLNGGTDGTASVSQTFSADVTKVWVNVANDLETFHGEIAEQLLWTSVLNESTHMLNSGGGVTDELRDKYAHY